MRGEDRNARTGIPPLHETTLPSGKDITKRTLLALLKIENKGRRSPNNIDDF